MNFLNLGIVYERGRIVNHRSVLKILLNPLLRKFGFQIGSHTNKNRTKIMGIKIVKTTFRSTFLESLVYDSDNKVIVFERWLF